MTETKEHMTIGEALRSIPRPRREPTPEPAPQMPPPPVRRRKPRREPAPAYVDGLAPYWPDQGETMLAIGRPPHDTLEPFVADTGPRDDGPRAFYRPRRSGPRGREIVTALGRLGVTLIPTIDGGFATITAGGRLDPAVRTAIDAARPLLRGYAHNVPLRCAMPHHVGGEPPEAVTLTLGGAAWCGACCPTP